MRQVILYSMTLNHTKSKDYNKKYRITIKIFVTKNLTERHVGEAKVNLSYIIHL